MASTGIPQLNVPVFAGQGSAAANTIQTRQQALQDATSPSGSILLSACHEAFHAELSSLSPTELTQANIDIADFKSKVSLLSIPDRRYLHNPIISGPTLFLIQSLRYIAFIQTSGVSTDSLTPFSDVLKGNLERGMGVLGFSSGILAACVVGTSLSAVTYISRAVEAYRLAIWIGVRSQIYRTVTLEASSAGKNFTLPWSLVFFGMNKQSAEAAIAVFSEGVETPSLYVTAVMDDMCVTISGRPDILAAFSDTLTTGSVVHKTTLDTLYHASIHVKGAREQVLADVTRRNIEFPDFSDIKVPIRSTFTGENLTKDMTSGSLVELVVDMLLTQPVNWNRVVSELVKTLPIGSSVRFLNVGPGSGLIRSMERPFSRERVCSLDLTISDTKGAQHGKPKQEPIAVVGMAVNMPGAPNVSKLWEVLEQGINTIAEIPEHRFTVSDYNDVKDRKSKRTMKAHTGNFIDGVDEFDNKFFKISPREAKSMDPQQRVLLHTAYEALENSGYVPDATPTSRPETFGCYIGVATHDYLQNLREDIDVYYSTGTLKAFLSGRISYAMQLSGPSIVIDTACSSSNVALYQASRALMNRDCDAAMVGGVNIVSSPDMFLGLDRGHFLSPTGQCKAFDASADGYSRGEGCGIFVLKRLSDAVAEKDNILGVIRGIEVNQSGLAHSITHPHAPTQATLFKQVLENSGIDANRVNVVEAHGTGTQAGDPNELESIRSVFATQRSPGNPLHITSVKANIGHLEAASGAAGLAKLLLMLQYRTIPRQISLKNLNPRIAPLESDNTIIDTTDVPWLPSHDGMTRVAMLNNFGAAGSNTTVLLEEFSSPSPIVPPPQGMPYIFGLSAKTEAALDELRSRYLQWLQSPENEVIGLADIAYTATARRQVYSYRLSVSASTRAELIENLRTASIAQPTGEPAEVVFVFSGQGGQYIGMGRSLYQTSSLFKHHIDECHSVLTSSGFPGVLPIITGTEDSQLTTLEEFEAYQSAIFSLQYALAKLWISWGLTPAAVVGHSIGEYAALVFANVLNLKGALLIVASRVRFMVRKCVMESTGMIAVNLESAAVKAALGMSKDFSELSISCYNSAIDCAASGPLWQLRAFKDYLDAEVHCKNVLLTVPFGYHSSAMTPLLDDLTLVAKQVTLRAPTIPVISNVFGEVVLPGDDSVFIPEYFARHCAEPVQFDKGIRALISQSAFSRVDAWIEIGPHTTSLPMLKANAALPKGSLLLGSLRKQQNAWLTLATSLSKLYVSNVSLHWREVFAHLTSVSCVSLPSYPFAKTKFWIHFKESGPVEDVTKIEPEAQHLISDYSMLHAWVQYPSSDNGLIAIFETPISQLAASIRGHCVGGMPLCPASVYLELVFAGIDLAKRYLGITSDDSHVVLRGIEFAKPLVYDEAIDRTVTTSITLNNGFGAFSVRSRVGPSAEELVHVHGEYRFQSTFQTLTKFSRTLPVITRHMAAVIKPKGGEPPEVFSTRTAYEVIFPRVVEYAKEYHTMRSLTVDASGMEGCANIKLPSDYDRAKFVVHPVFMDTLLHVAGFVANMQGGVNDAYICSEVGSVKVIPELVDNDAAYVVYCNNAWLPEERVMLAEAYAVQLANPKRIIAHLKGMQFRRVRLDSFKKGLAHSAGKVPLSYTLKPNAARPPWTPMSKKDTSSSSSRDIGLLVGDIQTEVLRVVSDMCGISATSVDVNTDLASLGVDSLMTIEIFSTLENSFPEADLNAHALSFCRSVADIVREVSSKVRPSQSFSGASSPPPPMSETSSPMTLVPDDKLPEPTPLLVDGEPDVKQVLASILDVSIKDIGDDADFESLGLDSLTSIEALYALKNEFGLDLPADFFTTCPTARSVLSFLSGHLRAGTQIMEPVVTKAIGLEVAAKVVDIAQTNITRIARALRLDTVPVSIQQSKTTDRLPLFLIHDGSGLVNYYDRLSPLDRNIWGIHNPRFVTAQPWDGVIQMAIAYTDYILSATSMPVILGGWSFGGVVAYEAALQLMKQGVQVKGVLLIDSPSPINHAPLSDSLIDSVVNLDARSANSELGRLVKTQFAMNTRMLGKYDPHATGGLCPPLALLRSTEGYTPPALADVPIWLADRSDPKLAAAGWDTLTSVKILDIPGHHFQPFHPSNIGEVSRRIAEACAYLEGL